MEAGAVRLRDVRGPTVRSRYGWKRFFRVLWHMAKADLQARYEAPILGYAWSVLEPLILAGILYLAFTRFIRFGGEIENYQALLIFNVMLFLFFSQSTSRTVKVFVSKRNIIRKVEVPLLIP